MYDITLDKTQIDQFNDVIDNITIPEHGEVSIIPLTDRKNVDIIIKTRYRVSKEALKGLKFTV
jgi:hypothetical protein